MSNRTRQPLKTDGCVCERNKVNLYEYWYRLCSIKTCNYREKSEVKYAKTRIIWILYDFSLTHFYRPEQTVKWRCSTSPRGQIMEWLTPSVWSCFIVTWSELPLTLLENTPLYTAGIRPLEIQHTKQFIKFKLHEHEVI